MVKYRRNKSFGDSYFFTVVLKNRRSKLLLEHIDILKQAFRREIQKRPFKIIAIVILPEHLHTILELPEGDKDYDKRWRSIKTFFSRELNKRMGGSLIKDKRGGYLIWQHRYWERTIRNEKEMQAYIDYIHYNPVKHQLVEECGDWPYSSYHQFNSTL